MSYNELPPLSLVKLGNPLPPTNKVYLTIFAGRERYLSILKKYLDVLLSNNTITEVHLWDYVRNPKDSIYIQKLAQANPKYVYMKPYNNNMKFWDEYYQYYANASYNAEDIIIKCDDDVVYIDTEQMNAYINEIKPNGLYYPNIINNCVCAYIQSKYNVHKLIDKSEIYKNYGNDTAPLTGWRKGMWRSCARVSQLHNEFLADKRKFCINAPVIPWKGRISINMFGAKFALIKEYYKLFLQHGCSDDEAFFSYNLYKYVNASNYIVPFTNIVHFAFGPQDSDQLDTIFLERYSKL
jgi:hypothetical protein